jgi:hypothetical protein
MKTAIPLKHCDSVRRKCPGTQAKVSIRAGGCLANLRLKIGISRREEMTSACEFRKCSVLHRIEGSIVDPVKIARTDASHAHGK